MARAGLYKSDVQRARDSLMAERKHPSVDAVRIALGNTGSKSTIHKYLKELETEAKDVVRTSTVSDALQDLVERLAERLHAEADARSDIAIAACAEKAKQLELAETVMRGELGLERERSKQFEVRLAAEIAAGELTRDALQAETVLRHTAEQQVRDLTERLEENEAHRLSLEEKHTHAREALEHFREAAREQRDQEQRRHEQQVQQLQAELRLIQQAGIVKQGELTRLNQEGATLVADLSHARQAAHNASQTLARQDSIVARVPALEQQIEVLKHDLDAKELRLTLLGDELKASTERGTTLDGQVRELELALARAVAASAAQLGLAEELRQMVLSDAAPRPQSTGRRASAKSGAK